MKKKEFMDELKEALAGRVPQEVYYDTVQYYDDYFRRQIAEGKSEEQITSSLGSARLLAKTIIETSRGTGNQQFYEMPEDRKNRSERRSENRSNYQKGWHVNVDDNGRSSIAFGRLDFGTVIGKMVLAFLVILVIAVAIVVVMLGVYILVPALIIFFIIYLLAALFNDRS